MSVTRQQQRLADRLKKKDLSAERAKSVAKHRAEWKEAWRNRFAIKRTPWQEFIFLSGLVLRALGWQYYVWRSFGAVPREHIKKNID
jgi:hypothetical protein